MSTNEEKGKLNFDLPRISLGIAALLLAVVLYAEYIRFLLDAEFAVGFRVLVFFSGQLICLFLLVGAGTLICKKMSCPECGEGQLIFPLCDLYRCLPSLPFAPRFIEHFTIRENDNFMLSSAGSTIKGRCDCCGAFYELTDNSMAVVEQKPLNNRALENM